MILTIEPRTMMFPLINGVPSEKLDTRLNQPGLEDFEEDLITIEILKKFRSEGYTGVVDLDDSDDPEPIDDYIRRFEENTNDLLRMIGLSHLIK